MSDHVQKFDKIFQFPSKIKIEISEENLSEEEEKEHNLMQKGNKVSERRIINQMSTKLPFSQGGDPSLRDVSARVLQGLIPSISNKTKALSKEQEKLY